MGVSCRQLCIMCTEVIDRRGCTPELADRVHATRAGGPRGYEQMYATHVPVPLT